MYVRLAPSVPGTASASRGSSDRMPRSERSLTWLPRSGCRAGAGRLVVGIGPWFHRWDPEPSIGPRGFRCDPHPTSKSSGYLCSAANRTWCLEPWMASTAPFLPMGSGGSQTWDAVTGRGIRPVFPQGASNRRTGSGKTYTICWGLRAGSFVPQIRIYQLPD